jgi:hypothetical protein
MKASDDEDEKSIINSFLPTLSNQFKELSLHIQDISTKAPLQNHVEVERFLKVSSAVSLANNFKLSLPSIGSLIGKLGIAGIIHEIKKLIEAIIELFGKIPKWLEKLFLIIDEIINDLLGGDSTKTKNMLSDAEQNFLKERRYRILLEKASDNSSLDEEEN